LSGITTEDRNKIIRC